MNESVLAQNLLQCILVACFGKTASFSCNAKGGGLKRNMHGSPLAYA